MVEFVHSEEKVIGIDEPITLENNTGASFDVGVGIIFRKSGIYRVSVDGKHTSVEIEPERKKGKWIKHHEPYTWMGYTYWTCSECNFGEKEENKERSNFCPDCGVDMRESEEDD